MAHNNCRSGTAGHACRDCPMSSMKGKVLMGTCGWSDESLLKCGRFYPSSVKTSEDRLATYSRHFACVEVDSSCYAIPRPDATKRWVAQTPPGFTFHFKAFGMLAARSGPANALPWEVRQQLPQSLQQGHVSLDQLPEGCEERLWELFHAALEPVIKAKRMGAVVFQFHLSFAPSDANKRHVLACRERLQANITMAVEFRNRGWFKDAGALQSLTAWLSDAGIVLIAADELKHETYQKDRQQIGLPAGQQREVLPIALAVTNPSCSYVRLHRRHGTVDRFLGDEELQGWASRLASLAPQLQGPIHFLWGTDYEDAPIVNARKLTQALSPELVYDYAAAVKRSAGKGSIHAFMRQGNRTPATREAGGAAGAAGTTEPAATAEPAATVQTAPTMQCFTKEGSIDANMRTDGQHTTGPSPAATASAAQPPAPEASSAPSTQRIMLQPDEVQPRVDDARASTSTAQHEREGQQPPRAGMEQQQKQQAPPPKSRLKQQIEAASKPSKRARTTPPSKGTTQEKPLSFYFASAKRS